MYIRSDYLRAILKFAGQSVVKVISGVRRSGKSVILGQLADHFEGLATPTPTLRINFELLEWETIADYRALHDFVMEKLPAGGAVFLDEIQMVDEWERTVTSLLARGSYDLYVSGSNARLLSGELASLLAGRYVNFEIHPFSFREFLAIRSSHADAASEFLQYVRYGGMPGLHHSVWEDTVLRQYLVSLHDSVVFKDIVARWDIRQSRQLEALIRFLYDTAGSLVSARRIEGMLKAEKRSMSVETVLNYCGHLEAAFLFHKAQRFDLRGKRLLQVQEKWYPVDTGLRNAVLGFRAQDIGQLIECVVFSELRRRGYAVSVGTEDEREIDFIATKPDQALYIQAAYLALEGATLERELALLRTCNAASRRLLLSLDEMPPTQIDGIERMNVRDWLLRE